MKRYIVMLVAISLAAVAFFCTSCQKETTEPQDAQSYKDFITNPPAGVKVFFKLDIVELEAKGLMAPQSVTAAGERIYTWNQTQEYIHEGLTKSKSTFKDACGGGKQCDVQCGRTIYRVTGIPDNCSCSGGLTISCPGPCWSVVIVCGGTVVTGPPGN